MNFMDYLVVAYVVDECAVRLIFDKAQPVQMPIDAWLNTPLPDGVIKPPLGTRVVDQSGSVGGSIMAYREDAPLPVGIQFPDGRIRPAG
ncbi:MAG: hypothetical protein RIE56_06645 [Amphiplicatus sp.]